jgi:hypothetical protein
MDTRLWPQGRQFLQGAKRLGGVNFWWRLNGYRGSAGNRRAAISVEPSVKGRHTICTELHANGRSIGSPVFIGRMFWLH